MLLNITKLETKRNVNCFKYITRTLLTHYEYVKCNETIFLFVIKTYGNSLHINTWASNYLEFELKIVYSLFKT